METARGQIERHYRDPRGEPLLPGPHPRRLHRRGADDVAPAAVARLYGRALGEVIPLLAWCAGFHLHAECVLEGRRLTLHSFSAGECTYFTNAEKLLTRNLFGPILRRVEFVWHPALLRGKELVFMGI